MKFTTIAALCTTSGLAFAAPTGKTAEVAKTEGDASADSAFFVINWRRDEKSQAVEPPKDAKADSAFFVVNWKRDAPKPTEESADSAFFVINWRKREAWPVEQRDDGLFTSSD